MFLDYGSGSQHREGKFDYFGASRTSLVMKYGRFGWLIFNEGMCRFE